MVILEDLVPADHLLRKVDTYINFGFIRDQICHLYCDNNGRHDVDVMLLFKMLLSFIRLVFKSKDRAILQRFYYLDHRTVDSKYNIITDKYVTTG